MPKKLAMLCFDNLERPENGYSIRSWAVAQRLKKEGYDVSVYQFAYVNKRTVRDGIPITSMKVSHQKPHKGPLERALSFNPFKELFFPLEGYFKLRQFKSELKKFDEFCIEGCLLINAFIFVKQLGKPIILDTQLINKDSAIKMQASNKLIAWVRIVIWHVIEKTMLSRVDRVAVVSENDRDFLAKHYAIAPESVEVIPHFVDAANIDKYAQEAQELRAQLTKQHKKVACFIGDLGAIQNVDSEKFIRSQLAPATKDVHYVLVGNNPQKLPSHENITYTGFVDSVDPYVLSADFCIAPLTLGSGVKTKVLDYLKYQKPVIATPIAVEGIQTTPETKVCNLNEFVGAVKSFQGGPA